MAQETTTAPRKRGRKPREKPSQDGEKANQKRISSEDEFFAKVQSCPDPSGVLIYIYLLDPVYDTTLAHKLMGEESIFQVDVEGKVTKYLEKIPPETFTREYMRTRWGYGRYQIRFTDANARAAYTECRLDQTGPEYMDAKPGYPLEGIVENKNSGHLKLFTAKGWWPPESVRRNREMAEVGQATTAAVQGLNAALTNALNRSQGQQITIKDLIALVDRKQDTLTLKDLMAFMAAQQRPAADNPATSSIRQTIGLLKELGLVKQPDAAESAGLSVGDGIIGAAKEFAGVALQAFALWVQRPQPGAPATVAPATIPAAIAPVEAEEPPLSFEEVAEFALDRFENDAADGGEFAVWLCRFAGESGPGIYDQLQALGTEGVLGFLRGRAEWARLAPREAELRTWLDEALEYYAPETPAAAPPPPEQENGEDMLPMVNKLVQDAVEAFRAGTTGAAFAETVKAEGWMARRMYGQIQELGAETLIAQLRTRPEWQQLVDIRGEQPVVDWITDFLAPVKVKKQRGKKAA